MPTLRYARYAGTDETTSHSTWLPNNSSQVAGYQGERTPTRMVTTPFVLSALRSKVYRSMSGVATAVFSLIALTNRAETFTLFAIHNQRINMTFSRWLLLFTMLFTLGWSASSHAASKTSASIVGTWYGAHGKSITFKKDGTINYRGKRYFYAVSSGGYIQLKGKKSDLTIPFLLAKGKLTLTEAGVTTVYRRDK